ncbi:GAF domain-containing sensor histidine kinase [Nocardioides sp. YIM 152315]|uniref:sensor histidine kinase n=1 Tax=Nocardioides sp. YIM 152315 TaxID=3031760 RepID=UPI0023DBC0A2|nr:GAF domain-containing sensor histidine kinase [Nocardioides sp. YIM 152315]MDF1604020.1 GAF domain-containing sensor histidine kinase [Nocardioides sp. YIM 152315]
MSHTAGSTTQRPASWPVAAVLPVLCLACVVGVLVLEGRSYGEPALWSFGEGMEVGHGIGTGLVGLVLGILSTIVLRHPGHRVIGWTLGGVGLFWALDGLSEAYVRLGVVTDHALPAMTFAVWFLARFTSLLPATIVVLPLLFPEGRFVRGGWGVASWACMAVLCLGALAYVVTPYDEPTASLPPGVDADWTTIWGLEPVADVLTGSLQAATIIGVIVPVGVVVHRYRRSRDAERDQMRWLLWGALVTATTIVVTLFLDLGALTGAVFFLCITLTPIAMTVAVVNPRVVSIEELLGRTVLLSLIAVVLVAIDFVVVAALTAALDDEMDQSQVVLVVLLTTVLLYGPLRQRLSRGVRRFLFGDRANPYDVVAGLASTLESADEGAEQLAAVARSVASAFGVGFVSVEVDRSSGERLIATYGTPPDQTRSLPITYRDAEVGRLVLPARGLRSRLSHRDEELLGDLVRQAATAARTSRLADELQESRERLVAAREEERRRIRRDLHDGLGPALSGVVFELESARLTVDGDPASAKRRIAGVSAHVQDVVADVRRLVHDLRPPALDDRGLVGALRQQGERLEPAATVEAAELGPLPAAVEVAAYRIAGEAMTNVARHARASGCTVRLEVVDSALLVEVADDGVGIDPAAQAGVGLVGLRERAAELGGRSEVTCPPAGGTVVRAWLPLRSAHD